MENGIGKDINMYPFSPTIKRVLQFLHTDERTGIIPKTPPSILFI